MGTMRAVMAGTAAGVLAAVGYGWISVTDVEPVVQRIEIPVPSTSPTEDDDRAEPDDSPSDGPTSGDDSDDRDDGSDPDGSDSAGGSGGNDKDHQDGTADTADKEDEDGKGDD